MVDPTDGANAMVTPGLSQCGEPREDETMEVSDGELSAAAVRGDDGELDLCPVQAGTEDAGEPSAGSGAGVCGEDGVGAGDGGSEGGQEPRGGDGRCPICHGWGWVSEDRSVLGEPPDYEQVDCPQCLGTGRTGVSRVRTEPLAVVAKDMMAYVYLVWEGRFELQQLEQQLAAAQQHLVLVKARAEQAIIEAAGGDKALGSNEDARKRAMIIALADAPEAAEYRELQETVTRCERAVALKRIGLENDLDQQTARRYIIRAAEIGAARNGNE